MAYDKTDVIRYEMQTRDIKCFDCGRLVVENTQALKCKGWGAGSEFPVFTTVDFIYLFYGETCKGLKHT